MNEIHESLTVLCPFDQIPKAAEAYLTSVQDARGTATIPVRVSVGDLVVERCADLKLTHRNAYPGYEIMAIEWRPHDGGPYPVFEGTLSVEDGGAMFSRLDLDGSYRAPLGIAGAVFDAVLGHRIALAAARAVLDDIRVGLEYAYQTGLTVV